MTDSECSELIHQGDSTSLLKHFNSFDQSREEQTQHDLGICYGCAEWKKCADRWEGDPHLQAMQYEYCLEMKDQAFVDDTDLILWIEKGEEA